MYFARKTLKWQMSAKKLLVQQGYGLYWEYQHPLQLVWYQLNQTLLWILSRLKPIPSLEQEQTMHKLEDERSFNHVLIDDQRWGSVTSMGIQSASTVPPQLYPTRTKLINHRGSMDTRLNTNSVWQLLRKFKTTIYSYNSSVVTNNC